MVVGSCVLAERSLSLYLSNMFFMLANTLTRQIDFQMENGDFWYAQNETLWLNASHNNAMQRPRKLDFPLSHPTLFTFLRSLKQAYTLKSQVFVFVLIRRICLDRTSSSDSCTDPKSSRHFTQSGNVIITWWLFSEFPNFRSTYVWLLVIIRT